MINPPPPPQKKIKRLGLFKLITQVGKIFSYLKRISFENKIILDSETFVLSSAYDDYSQCTVGTKRIFWS
jgi:hypothetical protein